MSNGTLCLFLSILKPLKNKHMGPSLEQRESSRRKRTSMNFSRVTDSLVQGYTCLHMRRWRQQTLKRSKHVMVWIWCGYFSFFDLPQSIKRLRRLHSSPFLPSSYPLNQTLPISMTNGRIIINWIEWFDSIESKPKSVKCRCEERVRKYLFPWYSQMLSDEKNTRKKDSRANGIVCVFFFSTRSSFPTSTLLDFFTFARKIVKIIIRRFHLSRGPLMTRSQLLTGVD